MFAVQQDDHLQGNAEVQRPVPLLSGSGGRAIHLFLRGLPQKVQHQHGSEVVLGAGPPYSETILFLVIRFNKNSILVFYLFYRY